MKICSKCKELKSLNEFSKHKTQIDGHAVWCKNCTRQGNNLSYDRLHAKGKKLRQQKQKELLEKGFKNCFSCGKDKKLIDFSPNRARKDGYSAWCRICMKEYRTKPDVKKRAYTRAKIYWREKQTKWDNYYNQKRYGITSEERIEIQKKQNNQCAICEKNFVEKRYIFLDHDHKTGKIRELLCRECNFILGYANDNTKILQSSIRYLQKHNP